MRPLLGTFFEISIDITSTGDHTAATSAAFQKGEELQKIFNLKDPDSEICRYNQNPQLQTSAVFSEILNKAAEFSRISKNSFSPFQSGHTDLNGIAKGYIVDQMVKCFDSNASGVINGGGDLRFFNSENREVSLRGAGLRVFNSPYNAVASSSLNLQVHSSTHYNQTGHWSATAFANDCMTADALTKVGLFANSEVAEACSLFYNAQIMTFDSKGELTGFFGAHETK